MRHRWSQLLFSVLLACLSGPLLAGASAPTAGEDEETIRIDLWPGGVAPGSEHVSLSQRIFDAACCRTGRVIVRKKAAPDVDYVWSRGRRSELVTQTQ